MVAIPDPGTYRLMPWKEGETKVGADDLRRRHARRAARTRAIRATSCAARSSACSRWASTRSTSAPSSSTSSSRTTTGTETLDEGGYFAMTTMDAASELRQETVRALEHMGIPVEYVHHEVGPSQHEIDMRFAPALEMADHTRHVPADREGDREEGRLPRDVHAEADLRRERLGDAHAPVALHRRAERASSTRTTSGTCPRPARRSSPASSATRARSQRSSRSG